jgi:hypothetical protein
MSWLRRLLQPFTKPTEVKSSYSASGRYAYTMGMAVKFDPSTVTESVKANLRRNIELLDDLEKKHVKQVYEAALRSVLTGRDMATLCTALMKIEGMAQGRAVEITRSLHNKATALINRDRQTSLGITHAIWICSKGGPCMRDPSHPTAAEVQQDSAHRSANGKKYEIAKGLLVDGKWTWPGFEEGCSCMSRSVMPWSEE